MTIQQKLLTYYENCLTELPEGYDEARRYCAKKDIAAGVCYAAHWVFNIPISSAEWVSKKRQPGSVYWCKIPAISHATSEIRTALTTRIEILRGIVNGTKTI